MEIRDSAETLKAFLGISSTASTRSQQVPGSKGIEAKHAVSGDQATVSQLGLEISHEINNDVRMERVVAIQQALAAGTYKVPATAVADRMIDAMLTRGISSGK